MGETMFRAAAAYDRHIGRYGAELARALIDAAGVAPGDRALDVGCGPGALTGALVARCSAPGAWPPSIRRRRSRRRAPRATRAREVSVAAAEALPFAGRAPSTARSPSSS